MLIVAQVDHIVQGRVRWIRHTSGLGHLHVRHQRGCAGLPGVWRGHTADGRPVVEARPRTPSPNRGRVRRLRRGEGVRGREHIAHAAIIAAQERQHLHIRPRVQRCCKRRAHFGVAGAASLALQRALCLPRARHHAVERGRRRRGRHNCHVGVEGQHVAATGRRNQCVQARAACRQVGVDHAIRTGLRAAPTEVEGVGIPHAIQALNLPKLWRVDQLALVVVQEPARLPLAVCHVNEAIQVDVGKRPRAERAGAYIPRAYVVGRAITRRIHRADVGIPLTVGVQRGASAGATLHRRRHGLADLVNARRHGDHPATIGRLRPRHHQRLHRVQVAARRNRKVGRQQVGRHVVHGHRRRRHRAVAHRVCGAEANRHAHVIQPARRRVCACKDRVDRWRDRILLRNRRPGVAVVAAQLHAVNVDEARVGHAATAQCRGLANHTAGRHGDEHRRLFIHIKVDAVEVGIVRIGAVDDELVIVGVEIGRD